jgi:hypothetical protein
VDLLVVRTDGPDRDSAIEGLGRRVAVTVHYDPVI